MGIAVESGPQHICRLGPIRIGLFQKCIHESLFDLFIGSGDSGLYLLVSVYHGPPDFAGLQTEACLAVPALFQEGVNEGILCLFRR